MATGIMARLEALAIEPGSFGHREHLEAAFEALRRDEFLAAATRYAGAIRQFAQAAGAAEKFNLTITLAYLGLVAERMATQDHVEFAAFLRDNPDLLDDPLATWYTPERRSNSLARRVFLLPDRTRPAYQAQLPAGACSGRQE